MTSFSIVESSDTLPIRWIKKSLEAFMGFPSIVRFLAPLRGRDPVRFMQGLLEKSEARLVYHQLEHLDALKPGRPVILIANHPRGILDGVAIFTLLFEKAGRHDFKFLSNLILTRILTELEPHFIPVNNFSRAASSEVTIRNGFALAEALKHLRTGGIIGIHPAGSVSEWRLVSPEGPACVTDLPWQHSFVDLWRRTDAQVLLIHLSGRNSVVFQLASLLGATAKRLLLFREWMGGHRGEIHVSLRGVMTLADLPPGLDRDAAGTYVREMLYRSP